MPSRRKPETDSSSPIFSFEDSMSEIEDIVESMEVEQLPLEQLIASYERGAILIKKCSDALTNAKNRIELITLNANESENMDKNPQKLSRTTAKGDSVDTDNHNDRSLF